MTEEIAECSPEEILIISRLVDCYLDVSRQLKKQSPPQNSQDADCRHLRPENRRLQAETGEG